MVAAAGHSVLHNHSYECDFILVLVDRFWLRGTQKYNTRDMTWHMRNDQNHKFIETECRENVALEMTFCLFLILLSLYKTLK